MFAFRLALALGYPHPDVLLRQLTAKQFGEWEAFYQHDPFGDQRADLRMGILTSVINNRWRGKNENAAKPLDFMPYLDKRDQTPEDIQRTLQSILGQVIARK